MQAATPIAHRVALAPPASPRLRPAFFARHRFAPRSLVSRHNLRHGLTVGVQGVAQDVSDHVPPLVTADRKWHESESLVHVTAIVCTGEVVSRTFLSGWRRANNASATSFVNNGRRDLRSYAYARP